MNRNELLKGLDSKHALFGMFFVFNNHLQTVGDVFYEDITCKQFFLLLCLDLFEEPPTINNLAEILSSSHQNIKQILNKLEAKGLVKITEDKKDRRKLRIKKTKKLEQVGKTYTEKEKQFFNMFYKGISDEEIAKMHDLFMKLETNLVEIKEEL